MVSFESHFKMVSLGSRFPVSSPNPFRLPNVPEPEIKSLAHPHFFIDHSGKKGRVAVNLVTMGPFGSRFKMICYSIPGIAIDLDGAPNAYAPPISATNTAPKNGLDAKDKIRNGTNDAHAVFHENGVGNLFHWTGVVSRAKSKTLPSEPDLDTRPFLCDKDGNFPVIETAGTYKGFYKPHSKQGLGGVQINATTTCFGVLSHSLIQVGIGYGDVGVIVNMKTGKGVSFMYCDSAGKKSVGVSEFSERVAVDLGGDNHPAAVFSFPGSADSGGAVAPEKTDSLIAKCLKAAPGTFILDTAVPRLSSHSQQKANVQSCLRTMGLHRLRGFLTPFHS
jgi:hypothetical protein